MCVWRFMCDCVLLRKFLKKVCLSFVSLTRECVCVHTLTCLCGEDGGAEGPLLKLSPVQQVGSPTSWMVCHPINQLDSLSLSLCVCVCVWCITHIVGA